MPPGSPLGQGAAGQTASGLLWVWPDLPGATPVTCSFSLRLMALWGPSFIGNQFERSSPGAPGPPPGQICQNLDGKEALRPKMPLLDVELAAIASGSVWAKAGASKSPLETDFQAAVQSWAT